MGEWISIKDRLPEDEEVYLTYSCGDMEIMLFDCFRTKKFMSFDMNGYPQYEDSITYWMPLPEPPKEDNTK